MQLAADCINFSQTAGPQRCSGLVLLWTPPQPVHAQMADEPINVGVVTATPRHPRSNETKVQWRHVMKGSGTELTVVPAPFS